MVCHHSILSLKIKVSLGRLIPNLVQIKEHDIVGLDGHSCFADILASFCWLNSIPRTVVGGHACYKHTKHSSYDAKWILVRIRSAWIHVFSISSSIFSLYHTYIAYITLCFSCIFGNFPDQTTTTNNGKNAKMRAMTFNKYNKMKPISQHAFKSKSLAGDNPVQPPLS